MTKHEGSQLGNFVLQTKLGEGGMGEVYAAEDVQLQRRVAVKVMHAHVAAHEVFRMRFLQEARSAAALDHPNIVRIYTFDIAPNGEHYLVMEFVQSGSLRGYIENLQYHHYNMEVTEALTLIQQIAAALDYAHSTNTIHRDIKPDNVLIKENTMLGYGATQYTAVLTDFGLAKLVDGNNLVQTQMNNPMGTLPYMAPEQFSGQADHRADLYALGVMMYEMLVGRLPFYPQSPAEAMQQHTYEQPPSPRGIRADLPPALEPILLKALAKQPAQRFQYGREIIQVIQQVLGGGTSLGSAANHSVAASPYPSDPANRVPPPQQQQPASSGQPQLLLEREGYASKTVPITKQLITIGRDPARDIPLAGNNISRLHAQIERERDGTLSVTDYSTNGTFMNGQRLPNKRAVTINGPLTVGPYRLTVVIR
jgi:serine/threonine protein kinase